MSEQRFQWSTLSTLQLARYAEHYATLRFLEAGYEVFASQVDDRGIDLLVRIDAGRCLEVQVKSVRKIGTYTFIRKQCLGKTNEERETRLRSGYTVCFLVFNEYYEPDFYLIPGSVWLDPKMPFTSKDYDRPEQTSVPEYGIGVSNVNRPYFDTFRFTDVLLAQVRANALSFTNAQTFD